MLAKKHQSLNRLVVFYVKSSHLISQLVDVIFAKGRLIDDPLQTFDGLSTLIDFLRQLLRHDVRVHLRLLLDLLQQRFRRRTEAGLSQFFQLKKIEIR